MPTNRCGNSLARQNSSPREKSQNAASAGSSDRERAGPQGRSRKGGAGAPGEDRLGLVAGEVVHLADQRDRCAERRRGDQPQGLADRRMVVELQRRAADVAGRNDREQCADPGQAGNGFPVGCDENQDRRAERAVPP